MNRLLVSYVVSEVARIADVNPSDITTSFVNGTVTLRNAVLRPETASKMLPLPIEEGHLPFMEIRIPNPANSSPLVVTIRGSHMTFPLDLTSPPEDRKMGEVLRGITNMSVLGHPPNSDIAQRTVSRSDSLSDGFGEQDGTTSDHQFSAPTDELGEDINDDDYLSCRSDGEASEAEEQEASAPNITPITSPGFLSYWRDRLMERLLNREIRFEFSSLTFLLPCDSRASICYEILIDKFTAVIEPPQTVTDGEEVKIVNISFDGISVRARDGGVTGSEVVCCEGLSVKITRVYAKGSEVELRKNTTITFRGMTSIIADEDTLFSFVKCQTTRDMMLLLPEYCRPYARLRSKPSLWHYTCCCVLQKIRDHRRRFNFNLSYLRLYAENRQRYMQLLGECHKSQSVSELQQELAEVEMDLRFTDVILYLRQKVQYRHGVTGVTSALIVPDQDNARQRHSTAATQSHTFVSQHVEWEQVRFVLPTKNRIVVTKTSLVVRENEKIARVGDISFINGSKEYALKQVARDGVTATTARVGIVDSGEPPLFSAEMREDPLQCEIKIVLHELGCRLRRGDVMAVLTPLMDALQKVLENERLISFATSPMAAPTAPPGQPAPTACVDTRTHTFILMVPRATLQVDTVALNIDQLSFTKVMVPSVESAKYGCTLKGLSVRAFGDDVISPISVTMVGSTNHIVVSEVLVHVGMPLWGYVREMGGNVSTLLGYIPPRLLAVLTAATPKKMSSSLIMEAEDLAKMRTLMQNGALSLAGNAQHLLCRSVRVSFEPLNATAMLASVMVAPVVVDACRPGAGGSHRGLRSTGTRISLASASVNFAHVAEIILWVDLAKGLQCNSVSSGGDVAIVSVPVVTCGFTYTNRSRTPGVDEGQLTLELVHGENMCMGSLRGLTNVTMDSVMLCESILVAPMVVLMKDDQECKPSTKRPYRSSFLQASVRLQHVELGKLLAVPLSALEHSVGKLLKFLCDELVPVHFYRQFFSSYSDIALDLQTPSCLINCGTGGGNLCLSVEHAPLTTEVMPHTTLALQTFGPLLKGNRERRPLLVLSQMERLAFNIDLAGLKVSLCHSSANSAVAGVVLALAKVTAQLPLGLNEFWSAEVRLQPAPPTTVSVESIEFTLRAAQAKPQDAQQFVTAAQFGQASAAVALVTAQVRALELESGEPDTLSVSFPTQGIAATPTESEGGSCASIGEDETNFSSVALRRWSCHVDFSQELWCYSAMMELIGTCISALAGFRQQVIISSNAMGAQCDLDELGDIFFTSPDGIVVVEKCTFSTSDPLRCLVVCERTCVIFRDCTFKYASGDDFVRVSGPTAVCVYEHCTYEPLPGSCSQVDSSPELKNEEQQQQQAHHAQRRRTWLLATIQSGHLAFQLTMESFLTVAHRRFAFTHEMDAVRNSTKLRLDDMRTEYSEGPNCITICPKFGMEVAVSESTRRSSLYLNCTLTVADLTIPLAVRSVSAVAELLAHCSRQASQSAGQRPTPFAVPPPPSSAARSGFTYSKWKVLVSSALVPITVALPNQMPVGKITVSNAFFWSTKGRSTVATAEGRLALQEGALWEFGSQSFASVLHKPLFFGLRAKLLDAHDTSFAFTVSEVDLALSTEQLRLLLSLTRPMPHISAAAKACEVVNYSGMDIHVQASSGLTPAAASGKVSSHSARYVVVPQDIGSIDGVGVKSVENVSPHLPLYNLGVDIIAVCAMVAELTNHKRVHIMSSVGSDLYQRIAVRTLFQIKNDTTYALYLRSPRGGSQCVIHPETVACIPDAMMSDGAPLLSIYTNNSVHEPATTGRPLWAGRPTVQEFFHLKQSRGSDPRSAMISPEVPEYLSLFGSDDALCFLRITYEVVGSVLVLHIGPAAPILVNDTRLEMFMDVVVASTEQPVSKERRVLPSGGCTHVYDADPFTKHSYTLSVRIGDTVFRATSAIDLFDNTESSIVFKHRSELQRYFELNVSSSALPGSKVQRLRVAAEHMCFVENLTGEPLFASREGGGPIGTLAGESPNVLPHACAAYLPLRTPITLTARGMQSVESFEVSDGAGSGGTLVECNAGMNSSAVVIVRPAAGNPRHVAIIPSIVMVNEAHSGLLRVRWAVKGKYERDGPGEGDLFLVQPGGAGSSTSSCMQARHGNTNCFSFSYNNGEFSSHVVSDLSPGTAWCAYTQCGATFHKLAITRSALCEPTVIAVSGPLCPFARLVNLTSAKFEEVGPMQVSVSASPLKENTDVHLTRPGCGSCYRISTAKSSIVEVEPDLCVRTHVHGDYCSVVVSERTSDGPLAHGADSSNHHPALQHHRCTLQGSHVSCRVRDGDAMALMADIGSAAVWSTFGTSGISAQCTVTDGCLWSFYDGTKFAVVEPCGMDFSLRDAHASDTSLSMASFQFSVTPLCVTISDVFLSQCQYLVDHCQAPPPAPAPSLSLDSIVSSAASTARKRLSLRNAVFSGVAIEATWDRSITPPKPYVAILPFVPSLHHVCIRLPKVQLRNVSYDSAGQLAVQLKQVFLVELVKQIPQVVSSVGLFRRQSSLLDKVSSKIISFFFGGGEPSTSDDFGDSALV